MATTTVIDALSIALQIDTSGVTQGATTIRLELQKLTQNAHTTGNVVANSTNKMATGFSNLKGQLLGTVAALAAVGALASKIEATANSLARIGQGATSAGMDVKNYVGIGNAIKLMGGNADEAMQSLSRMKQNLMDMQLGKGDHGMRGILDLIGGSTDDSPEAIIQKAIETRKRNVHGLNAGQWEARLRELGLSDDLTQAIAHRPDTLTKMMPLGKSFAPDQDAIDKARELDRAFAQLGLAVDKLKRDFIIAWAPALTNALDNISKFIKDNPEAAERIAKAIGAVALSLTAISLLKIPLGVLSVLGKTAVGGAGAVAGINPVTAGVVAGAAGHALNVQNISKGQDLGFEPSILDPETGTPMLYVNKKTGETIDPAEMERRSAGVPGMASGTGEVPKDMLAQLHKGEMVVPAAFAQGIRSMMGGSGGRSEIDLSNSTIRDIASAFRRALQENDNTKMDGEGILKKALEGVSGGGSSGGGGSGGGGGGTDAPSEGGTAAGGKGGAYERASKVVDALMKEGISEEDATAIAARSIHESGADWDIKKTGDKSLMSKGGIRGSHGLLQWNRERVDKFREMNNGLLPEQAGLEANAKFVKWELEHTERRAWDKIQKAQGVGAKGAAVSSGLIRPANRDAEAAATAATARRLQEMRKRNRDGEARASAEYLSPGQSRGMGGGSSSETQVAFNGPINIHTQAHDAQGIAKHIHGEMSKRLTQQANSVLV